MTLTENILHVVLLTWNTNSIVVVCFTKNKDWSVILRIKTDLLRAHSDRL